MKETFKVSILVNCYNSEKYLKQALDSIYAQTYQNFEIVLVDNCSKDRTAEIAKSYDHRLKYVKTEETVPLYAGRNVGLPFVDGEYFCFLDSDDFWFPNKLAHQVDLMERLQIDFLYGNYLNLYEGEGQSRAITFKKIYLGLIVLLNFLKRSRFVSRRSLITNYDINLQTVMIRTSKIKGLRFDDRLNLMGDLDFFFKLFWIANAKAYFDRKVVSVSRIHARQLSRQNAFAWSVESHWVLKQLNVFLSQEEHDLFFRFFIRFYRSSSLLEHGRYALALRMKKQYVLSGPSYCLHYIKTCLIVIGKAIRSRSV